MPPATAMPANPESQPTSEPDRLEMATDQAIAACGGNVRNAKQLGKFVARHRTVHECLLTSPLMISRSKPF
jgi:hypothetical protein